MCPKFKARGSELRLVSIAKYCWGGGAACVDSGCSGHGGGSLRSRWAAAVARLFAGATFHCFLGVHTIAVQRPTNDPVNNNEGGGGVRGHRVTGPCHHGTPSGHWQPLLCAEPRFDMS